MRSHVPFPIKTHPDILRALSSLSLLLTLCKKGTFNQTVRNTHNFHPWSRHSQHYQLVDDPSASGLHGQVVHQGSSVSSPQPCQEVAMPEHSWSEALVWLSPLCPGCCCACVLRRTHSLCSLLWSSVACEDKSSLIYIVNGQLWMMNKGFWDSVSLCNRSSERLHTERYRPRPTHA